MSREASTITASASIHSTSSYDSAASRSIGTFDHAGGRRGSLSVEVISS